MSKPLIVTQGKGRASLKAYFELIHDSPPHKLPEKVSDWVVATYEAPYGFLYTWPDGVWRATFVLNAVAADIRKLSGVQVRQSSEEDELH